LIRRLERVAGAEGGGETPAPVAAEVSRGRRRSWRWVLAAALVLLALVVGAALALGGSGDDDGGSGGDGDASTEDRLIALIPSVTRSSCSRIDYGDPAAEVSLTCSGARLAVTYQLFPSTDVMNAWYAQQREEVAIEPDSGSCTGESFRGEEPYRVGGQRVGSYFCFVDDEGESEIYWSDKRVSVGSAASIYEGTGRAAAESLLRQWRCCLQLQP
jgi:hypothetical protein